MPPVRSTRMEAQVGAKTDLTLYLANPRGFCAGVVRAIDVVEMALEKWGAPVYVRHEIVHNRHVVDGLREKAGLLPQYALHPSIHEDDADRVAGALVRKSGGTTADIDFLYDVLAFYSSNRGGSVTSIAQVLSPQFQNQKPNAQYASVAERKAIARAAFDCE